MTLTVIRAPTTNERPTDKMVMRRSNRAEIGLKSRSATSWHPRSTNAMVHFPVQRSLSLVT